MYEMCCIDKLASPPSLCLRYTVVISHNPRFTCYYLPGWNRLLTSLILIITPPFHVAQQWWSELRTHPDQRATQDFEKLTLAHMDGLLTLKQDANLMRVAFAENDKR